MNLNNKFKETMRNLDYMKVIQNIIFMVLGSYLISFAIKAFLLPNKLSTGGASGVATIFYYISDMPMGITVLLINIPLFIVAMIKLGIRFSVKAIITTVLLSVFLDLFDYSKFIQIADTDLFISAIFGGLILGIGISLVFKVGASSGGSDLLAQIIYRLTSLQSVSQILLAIDTIIILSIVLVFKNINLGLYSIVAIFVSKKVIEIIFEGIYYTKIVTIITKNPNEITVKIFEELNRSATITKAKGAYSDRDYYVLTVLVTLPQISGLKQIVRNNDNKAIVYISNANEVFGKGFKAM
ncbi:MAG: YitT family protein [Clostridia bacterium]|nr:YitT family protein [Clostridia bacterium]